MFTGFCHFLPSLYPLFRPSLFQVVVNVSLPRSPYPMLRSISDGFRAQRRHIPPMQVRLHCDRKIAWQVPWQGIFMNTCWKLPMLRSDKQFPYISKLFPSLYQMAWILPAPRADRYHPAAALREEVRDCTSAGSMILTLIGLVFTTGREGGCLARVIACLQRVIHSICLVALLPCIPAAWEIGVRRPRPRRPASPWKSVILAPSTHDRQAKHSAQISCGHARRRLDTV